MNDDGSRVRRPDIAPGSDITAQPVAGNLLGSLLCAVVNLLNNPSGLADSAKAACINRSPSSGARARLVYLATHTDRPSAPVTFCSREPAAAGVGVYEAAMTPTPASVTPAVPIAPGTTATPCRSHGPLGAVP